MININNKSWNKLRSSDIRKLLSEEFEENCFFELKADDVSPEKLAHEISAFANTYGGYILLGINDDKTIGGCKKWNEQKINGTFHDNITPTPNFDVKKFRLDDKTIYVIKIEEGTMPPYITNKGGIYERVSSGTCIIKDSIRLSQLSQKKENQLKRIKEKIELKEIIIDTSTAGNFCGYLDMGFSVICSEETNLFKNFWNLDLEKVSNYIRNYHSDFSISRVGYSYVISIGKLTIADMEYPLFPAGMQNFIEIMSDGSVRCRVLFTIDSDTRSVNISHINFLVCNIFKKIYKMLLGNDFDKIFICAYKYEKLTVLKQFIPYYHYEKEEDNLMYLDYLKMHKQKYGNNFIITGNRIPPSEYILIDKRFFDLCKNKYNTDNLISFLFNVANYNLGYIDLPPQ